MPWLGADSPAHKALGWMWLVFSSGVGSAVTNPSNFDSLIFVEQVGIQNIVRIIVKPSICFGGIEKKQGKSRDIIL